MVFEHKTKKIDSMKMKNKRIIVLLNADLKLLFGIEVTWPRVAMSHTVLDPQYAYNNNKISLHTIHLVRDAVFSASISKEGTTLAYLDFETTLCY